MRPTLYLLCLLWAFFPSIDHLGAIAIPTPQEPALHGPELLPRVMLPNLRNMDIVLGRGASNNGESQPDEKWTIYIGTRTAFRLQDQKPVRLPLDKPRSNRATLIGHVTFEDTHHRDTAFQAMVEEVQGAQTNLIYIIRSLAKLEVEVGEENLKLETQYYDMVRQMVQKKGTADGGVISGDETTEIYESMEAELERARLAKLTMKELKDVADGKLIVID
ncbi:hypothetical protein F5050DRAFT_1455360 [Lentinula boryana]|uniref:Uncharacterized protein n=1 Tax=Lentinula boryana TaxID=40481 RepID=A0ABQ8QFA3_9AGAR|nr:hypothetical protein F5050DRAFT_1455360 [Lentinula boryana]